MAPRVGRQGAYPADVAGALMGLRAGRIIVPSWTFTPTVGILAKDVQKLGLDIRSFRDPLSRSVKRVLIPSIRKNFEAQGRPAWEPLSEVTVKLRGASGPILNRSGRLKRKATQFNIWTITREAASLQSLPADVWYGAVHQAGHGGFTGSLGSVVGSGAARVRIPARPFVMFQNEDGNAVREVFAQWLTERLARVGRFG